jgi:hypothetical protein
MGVSKRLKVAYAASRNFAPTLESILGDTGMQERAKALSKKLQAEPDGGCAAVDHIIQEIL